MRDLSIAIVVMFSPAALVAAEAPAPVRADDSAERAATANRPVSIATTISSASRSPDPSSAIRPTGAQSDAQKPQDHPRVWRGHKCATRIAGGAGRGRPRTAIDGSFFLTVEPAAEGDDATTQPAESAGAGSADSDSTALAKKLQNPVADLISVPFQSNFGFGGGIDQPTRRIPRRVMRLLPGRGARLAARALNFRLREQDRDQAFKYLLNFQPVIPISLSKDWNLISRTILPVVAQDDVIGVSSQQGLGDLTQSFFFSPNSTEPFIWGVGPAILIPTATDDLLGSDRWGLGPTGVILKQDGPWTYGILANQIWGFQRNDGRKNVNATFLQPFLSYTFKTATTITLNTESTYDWIDSQWNVPLLAAVSQVVKIGKLPVSLLLGGQYWVEKPDTAPDWSIRFQVTFLFPK